MGIQKKVAKSFTLFTNYFKNLCQNNDNLDDFFGSYRNCLGYNPANVNYYYYYYFDGQRTTETAK